MTFDSELHKRLIRVMSANTFAERYGFTQEDGWILLDMHLNVARKTANEMLRRATRAEERAAALEEKTDIEQAALWVVFATTLHVSVVDNRPLTENDLETFRQCMTAVERTLGLPSPEVRENRKEQHRRDLERDVPFLVSQLREIRSRTPPVQPTKAAEVPAPRVDKFSWGAGSHTSYLKKTA